MKNSIYALLFLAVFALSCKKDSKQFIPQLEQESFYPIGTVLKLSSHSIINQTVTEDAVLEEFKGKKKSYLSGSSYELAFNPTNPGGERNMQFLSGGYMTGSKIARSTNFSYSLDFQTDGNLVLYNISRKALWSNRQGAGNSLVFQSDGNIVAKLGDYVTWSGGVTAGPNPIWILQDDGNLVGYSNHTTNGDGTITITGSAFGSTGTAGGKVSSRLGRLK